jgi:hypothetical protein
MTHILRETLSTQEQLPDQELAVESDLSAIDLAIIEALNH